MSKVLGLDIGGANIKAAVNDGRSIEIGFPLWKRSPELVDVLQADILARFSDCDHVAVTMTGELCDCFRRTGRQHLHGQWPVGPLRSNCSGIN